MARPFSRYVNIHNCRVPHHAGHTYAWVNKINEKINEKSKLPQRIFPLRQLCRFQTLFLFFFFLEGLEEIKNVAEDFWNELKNSGEICGKIVHYINPLSGYINRRNILSFLFCSVNRGRVLPEQSREKFYLSAPQCDIFLSKKNLHLKFILFLSSRSIITKLLKMRHYFRLSLLHKQELTKHCRTIQKKCCLSNSRAICWIKECKNPCQPKYLVEIHVKNDNLVRISVAYIL